MGAGWIAAGLACSWLAVAAVALVFLSANDDDRARAAHRAYFRGLKRGPRC